MPHGWREIKNKKERKVGAPKTEAQREKNHERKVSRGRSVIRFKQYDGRFECWCPKCGWAELFAMRPTVDVYCTICSFERGEKVRCALTVEPECLTDDVE